NAEDFLDDTFIIISGDALTNVDIANAVRFHKEKKSKATLVLKKESIPLEYGVVITDASGRIIRFLEKPSWGEVFSDTINTGIYVLEPEVLSYFKKGENFDFSKDLFPKLLRDKVPMFGYVCDEYWNDIGDLRVYNVVNSDVLNKRIRLDNNYRELEKDIWVGSNTVIDEDCNIVPPVIIGCNCIIKKGSFITESIIGDNCEISENCSLKKSILWRNCDISPNVHCRGTVLCNNVKVKNSVQIFENTVVGNDTIILSGATIKPGIKIWPEKTVEEDAIVSQNLIWGTRVSKTLFGFRDITGEINTELSPEFASKLGSAFGSMFSENARIVISTDESNSAAVIKEALISGVLSTGIRVIDIDKATMPINRFAVRFYNTDGGVHIRRDFDPDSSNKVHIEIVNSYGINIDRNTERKIESMFARGDFKRCNADKIKDISRIKNFFEFYIQHGANMLKAVDEIKKRSMKLVIGSRSELMLMMASGYLTGIGCRVEADYTCNQMHLKDYIPYIAEQVVRKGAEMGVVFSEDGESSVIIDHKGNIIDNQKYTALASLLVLRNAAPEKLVVPYTATRKIENMASDYNATVLRTKSTPSELMKHMIGGDKPGNTENLQYLLHYDSIRGIGLIAEYIASNSLKLADMIDELPEMHMEKKEIKCSWENKGRVIREIIEEYKDREMELFEGVLINDDRGWVLVLPDSERAVCNVYTEGTTEEYARELAAIYSEKISGIVGTKV
ncbi:MAG: sugar phosphate nucleotidyltransferase, partial [Bacillota bacterium]